VQDILFEKMRDLYLGRTLRRTKGKGEIAKHYRDEYARLAAHRERGAQARIEFVGW
jgi:hypothetical protein